MIQQQWFTQKGPVEKGAAPLHRRRTVFHRQRMFELAFSLIKSGKPVNCEGAAGTIDFDQKGDVIAPIAVWRFKAGIFGTYRKA